MSATQPGSDLILVADDSAAMRALLEGLLRAEGFAVVSAADGQQALEVLVQQDVAVAIIDLEMPERTGLEVVAESRKIAPEMPVIVLSAHVQHEVALDCMASGAFDFIPKPISREVLLFRLKRALHERRKADELITLRAAGGSATSKLVAASPAMQDLLAKVRALSSSEETVLITGETGSGKEALAREIHRLSRRSGQQFFAVNLGALSETLLESELFGHEKGAFTGAVARRKGFFEMAHGGTLFLDELGEVSPSTQVKLLRVLEERTFVRVGGSQPVHVDVRLISATHRDLEQMLQAGAFRADLYYRLFVLPLHLPPLRERPEDIVPLLQLALERSAPGRRLVLAPSAIAEATRHGWPGNVRELFNCVARAVALCQEERIDSLGLQTPEKVAPATPEPASLDRPLKEYIAEVVDGAERAYLRALLQKTGGNLTEAAELAQVDRKSIYNKLKAYRMAKEDFR